MQMNPILKKGLAVGIILVFIGVAIAPRINSTVVKTSKYNDINTENKADLAQRTSFLNHSPIASPIITYNSWIIIKYDEEYVNQTEFIPNNGYMIPASIGYRVDVPHWLLNFHFRHIKNWFLFQSLIFPVMIINVSVENAPTWADIYPVPSNIYVDIGNEFFIVNITLVVVIHNQAPPGPFTFSLIAEAPALHRINGYLVSRNITITVQ